MKRKTPPPSSTGTALEALREPDRFLQDTVQNARSSLDRCVRDAASFAQREPEKALLSAVATGYVLRMLPVVGFTRMFLRLALCLIKPAALIYGGAKLFEKMQKGASETPQNFAKAAD